MQASDSKGIPIAGSVAWLYGPKLRWNEQELWNHVISTLTDGTAAYIQSAGGVAGEVEARIGRFTRDHPMDLATVVDQMLG